MTIKQCNSCKYHILVKELGETCFLFPNKFFMKSKNCELYKDGKINQEHKEYFNKIGHYTNVQNKKKLLLNEWGEKNEIIKKEKGKEFYLEKLILKYVGNYSVGEVNGSVEEIVWKAKE